MKPLHKDEPAQKPPIQVSAAAGANVSVGAAFSNKLEPLKELITPSRIQAVVEEWAADLIANAPSPIHRAPFEVMQEALPDLIRRLESP